MIRMLGFYGTCIVAAVFLFGASVSADGGKTAVAQVNIGNVGVAPPAPVPSGVPAREKPDKDATGGRNTTMQEAKDPTVGGSVTGPGGMGAGNSAKDKSAPRPNSKPKTTP
jgi:hypothetical protein